MTVIMITALIHL